MPADPDALAAAGVHRRRRLRQLDGGRPPAPGLPRRRLRRPASWPVSNVFSLGDVVLVVAALLALHCLCGSRLALVRFAAPRAR